MFVFVCVCVCVPVRVRVHVHARALALDCVSCSEGLRFCDVLFRFKQTLSRTVSLSCKPFLSAQVMYVEFFYRLCVFPFVCLCVCEREIYKSKEKLRT